MLQPERVRALVASLGAQEQAALRLVQSYGGSIPAGTLERQYGTIRTTDAYPNARVYLLALEYPPSPVERLSILGLIQLERAGTDRLYSLAPDVAALLPPVPLRDATLRPAPMDEPPEVRPGELAGLERTLVLLMRLAHANELATVPNGALNKASLVRVARQWDRAAKLDGLTREQQWPYLHFVRIMAYEAGLMRVDAGGQVRVTRTALDWMRQPRLERARSLVETWALSGWDELTNSAGYHVENIYRRNLRLGKRRLLELLRQLPHDQWLDIGSLAAEIARVEPDFARPDGDYYAWRIKSRARVALDGFEHWNDVEGRLVQLVAGQSLHWLGLFDIGIDDGQICAIRMTALGAAVLCNADSVQLADDQPLVVQPNFEVVAPPHGSPAQRFQLGRIAELRAEQPTATFRLTRRSVQHAREQGITLDEILAFLETSAGPALPQNVRVTLTEWADEYGRIAVSEQMLLEADSAATLANIQRDKRVRLPAVTPVGERAWAIAPGDLPGLVERLRKAGYPLDNSVAAIRQPLSERELTVMYAALTFYVEASRRLQHDHDASATLLRQVARLLPHQQLNRAYQLRDSALTALDKALHMNET
jgi:hypothetical protein